MTFLALGLFVGCSAPPDPAPVAPAPDDGDGDGLLDSEELEIGSDPAVSDSDGDGFDDGAEVAANTDPLDPERHPYTGGWPIGACAQAIEATGTDPGDVAPDFALTDQFGDTVHLHDFCDRVVAVVFCTPSHGGCLEPLPGLQELYQEHWSDLMITWLMHTDAGGSSVERSDLVALADDWGLGFPVLDDDALDYYGQFMGNLDGAPSMIVVGRGSILLDTGGDLSLDEVEAAAVD